MKKYVVSDPNILGGTPVIKGTRVPIERVLFLLKEGFNLDAIHQDYPHISLNTLSKSIDEVIHEIINSFHVKKTSQI